MALRLYCLILFVLVFVHAISGEISQVSNVVVKAKPLQETSAVLITWDAPTNPKNESKPNIILYVVRYCKMARRKVLQTIRTTQSYPLRFRRTSIFETSCVARNVSTTQVNITNLKKNFIYSYHITPLATNGQQGKEHYSWFTTKNKRTCLPNQYTCAVSDQCIKCDDNVSCADASDEDYNAKCARVLELEQSASVTPTKHQESISVSIAWSVPADLKGNKVQRIRYRVLYCIINTKCTIATPMSTLNKVVLRSLTPHHIYQFTIEVYNANNLMGPKSNYTHFFRTWETDTCKDGLFSCTRSSQCVLKERTCNGIVDCRDGTDEQSAGNCSVPKSTVTLTRADVTKNSITIIFNAVRDMSQRIHRYDVQNLQTSELKAVRHTSFSLQRDISVTFSGFQPETKYSFRIRSANPSGAGKWSSTIERITKGDKPTITVGPTVTVTTKTTITETVTTIDKMLPTSEKRDASENSKNTGMLSAQKAGIAIVVIPAVIIVIIAAIIILKACRLNRKNENNVDGLSNSAYEMEKNA